MSQCDLDREPIRTALAVHTNEPAVERKYLFLIIISVRYGESELTIIGQGPPGLVIPKLSLQKFVCDPRNSRDL